MSEAGFWNRIKLGNSLDRGMSIISAQQMNSNQRLRIKGNTHHKDCVAVNHPFTTQKSEDARNALNVLVYTNVLVHSEHIIKSMVQRDHNLP